MSVKKLFRVIVRQRFTWMPGYDDHAPESNKPRETEGPSLVKDITDYVEDYRINQTRGAIATEATLEFINPNGDLTPTNSDSPFNRSTVKGIDTFTPLLVEGNEIQIFRVNSVADLSDMTKWIPRFRGKIRSVQARTAGGFDYLQVAVGSALTELTKRNFVGAFSPVMYSTSVIPGNEFFTLPTLVKAAQTYRAVSYPILLPMSYDIGSSMFGDPSKISTNEIDPVQLSKLLWWDKDDVFRKANMLYGPEYWSTEGTRYYVWWSKSIASSQTTVGPFADEPSVLKNPVTVPVNSDTACGIWNLNGHAWYVESGKAAKLATDVLDDPTGSLSLQRGTVLRFETTDLPCGNTSRISLGVKIPDSGRVMVSIDLYRYDRKNATYTFLKNHCTSEFSGPTLFDPALVGGNQLNSPPAYTRMWKRMEIPVPAFDANSFKNEKDSLVITLARVTISCSTDLLIDMPRWEFLSIGRSENDTAVHVDTNIMGIPTMERWTTEDGIIYKSPFPQHRTMSKKNVRVILRFWGAPIAAGTALGYGPNSLRNRALPTDVLYERELAEGVDYETLFDKGAIQLSKTFRRCEIFVASTYYDLAASPHMEASSLMKRLMIEGGIPGYKISLEPTGIILSKVTLSVDTSTSLLKALKDIIGQLPQNYLITEDGDGNIIGRYIQQSGSPRIFNPVLQVPTGQAVNGVLQNGTEYWYGVTAIMPDGKETLLSNVSSTIPYSDYFDWGHKSIVIPGVVPALRIKPVPNMEALVIRRAKSYRPPMQQLEGAIPKPAYYFPMTSSDPSAIFMEDIYSSNKKTTMSVGFDNGISFVPQKVVEITNGSKKK